jgi:hypothetical protein
MLRFHHAFVCAAVAGGLAISSLPVAAEPAPPVQHVRGTVVKASDTSMTVATSEGSMTLSLTAKTIVAGVVPASISDIRPNSFIGVTNIPRPGDARAVGVFLLPDALKNQAGNFPWDYPGAEASGSRMTNGQVALGSRMTNGNVSLGSRMTNGTVSHASSNGPLRVTVSYKGGSIDAVIPPNTPVVRVVPATWKALTPGAHVFAAAVPGNKQLTAVQIIVGEQGVTPPM